MASKQIQAGQFDRLFYHLHVTSEVSDTSGETIRTYSVPISNDVLWCNLSAIRGIEQVVYGARVNQVVMKVLVQGMVNIDVNDRLKDVAFHDLYQIDSVYRDVPNNCMVLTVHSGGVV